MAFKHKAAGFMGKEPAPEKASSDPSKASTRANLDSTFGAPKKQD